MLADRLQKGRERLEEVREEIAALCEPVAPPRDTAAYLRFFCPAESGKDHERKRVTLYKLVGSFLRAYANLANEMREAGYADAEAQAIKDEVAHYEKVRREIKLASGDYIDLKMYEPAMRHLLDAYIRAEESGRISIFDNQTLVQLIAKRGENALASLPAGIRANPEAMAETIENNVRRIIVDEMAVNPKYYEKMSELLDTLIRQRRRDAIDYEAYLSQIVALAKRVDHPQNEYSIGIDNSARRALFDNLKEGQLKEGSAQTAALAVDQAIRRVKKADWRNNRFKEREIQNAIESELEGDAGRAKAIFEIVKARDDY